MGKAGQLTSANASTGGERETVQARGAWIVEA